MSRSITVVIPTHNRAALLSEAIDSVLNAEIGLTPSEILVVDDNSHDDTAAVAAAKGVRYIRTVAGTPGLARNAGLERTETEYVTFLDDDDCWLPGNMTPQLAALEEHPAAAYAYGRTYLADAQLHTMGDAFPRPPLATDASIKGDLPQIGAVLFRRKALLEGGGFTPLRYAEDGELMTRIAGMWPVIGIDFPCLLFRQRRPSAAGAIARWTTYRRDAPAAANYLRQAGIRIPLRVRIRENVKWRGLISWELCVDAAAVALEGQRAEALRILGWALWVSPPHSLRQRAFWVALRAIALGRRHAGRAAVREG